MGELIVPAAIGIFTDVAGLLVLAISSIPVIAKMGYFCAVWSASNLITVAVLVPLVMSVLPVPRTTPEENALPARVMARQLNYQQQRLLVVSGERTLVIPRSLIRVYAGCLIFALNFFSLIARSVRPLVHVSTLAHYIYLTVYRLRHHLTDRKSTRLNSSH